MGEATVDLITQNPKRDKAIIIRIKYKICSRH